MCLINVGKCFSPFLAVLVVISVSSKYVSVALNNVTLSLGFTTCGFNNLTLSMCIPVSHWSPFYTSPFYKYTLWR